MKRVGYMDLVMRLRNLFWKMPWKSHLVLLMLNLLNFVGQVWSYLRGGLTTLDRDYGWINNIHHDIGTHVIHHLFPQIPHYHLIEAVSLLFAKSTVIYFNFVVCPSHVNPFRYYFLSVDRGCQASTWEVLSGAWEIRAITISPDRKFN